MAFEVVLKFRFDDILYPEGTPADDVIDLLTNECERLSRELHADSVWVDDAYMTKENANG